VTAPAYQPSAGLDETGRPQRGPSTFVPLREQAETRDPNDLKRIALVRTAWSDQDDLVRQQNRQIEENVRMLAGQQHILWHPVAGRYLDITEWMSDDERKWRVRPVINRLLPWFILTHARATENQPIVTFVPGPDRADAELAEILDIASKSVWFEANMEDAHDRMMGWVIVAGRGHLMSRINPAKGRSRPWIGGDLVPLFDESGLPVSDDDGGQAYQPFEQGRAVRPRWPAARQGDPARRRRDRLAAHGRAPRDADRLGRGRCALAHAGPWLVGADAVAPEAGPPHPSYHTPEEVYDWFGVEVQPTVKGGAKDIGELERLQFGTGFYGSTGGTFEAQSTGVSTEGYVEVTSDGKRRAATAAWRSPTPPPEAAGPPSRRTRSCATACARPRSPFTSPLSTFEFVRVPGRPGGTTPQESLNPLQRMYNAGYGQIREHVNLVTNPKGIIDAQSGMKPGKFTNRPGENYVLNRRPGVPAIEYVEAPQLGTDTYKLMQMVREEFEALGFTNAGEQQGDLGTSGEQLKEARFNTDRFLGPTMRRSAGEYGRMFETWKALYPLVWDMETVISYAGEDNIARTITVFPEMFKHGLRQRAPRCGVDVARGPGRASAAGLQDVLGRPVR
jgi:hypothetical protein